MNESHSGGPRVPPGGHAAEANGAPGPRTIANVLPLPAMVFLTIVSAQLGAAGARVLLASLSLTTVVLLRTGFAALVLWPMVRPRIRQYSRLQWRTAALLGLVTVALSLAFYASIARIPLGVTMTIEFLGPITVALAGSRKALDFIWPILAFAGILLLAPIGNPQSLSLAGIGFAFAAAAGWAGYLMLTARAGAIFAGTTGLALAMAFASLVVLPVGLMSGGKALLDLSLLGKGFSVSMLSTVIPFSLEFLILKRMSPGAYGVLCSADPAVAALIGMVVLHQHLSLREWIALAVVSIATAGVMSHGKDRKRDRGANVRASG